MQDKLSLRPATAADRSFVTELEEVCMRDYATALWGKWKPSAAEEFTPLRITIIVWNNADVGCVEIERHPDHLWLDRLYLLPTHQRRGFGATILHTIIEAAKDERLVLRLSVLITNPAEAFYRREGLRERMRTPERITFETAQFP
jgi:GNAT superfamily N-acetyltransferase